MAASQVVILALCGILFKGGALNTDFGAFLRGNSPSSLRYDAYSHAWSKFNPAPDGRRLQGAVGQVRYKHTYLRIAYHGKDGKNLLDEDALFAISRFEQRMQGTASWKKHCALDVVSLTTLDEVLDVPVVAEQQPEQQAASSNSSNSSNSSSSSTTPAPSPSPPSSSSSSSAPKQMQPSCSPGESFVNYVWPTYMSGTGGVSVMPNGTQQLRLDGSGNLRLPVSAVLAALRDEEDFFDRLGRFLPPDTIVPEGAGTIRSDLLQSHFLFSQSIGSGGYYKSSRSANDALESFMSSDLHSALSASHAEFEEMGIRVFYSATLLDDADLFDALFKDLQLSIGGLVLVFILVRVHTTSWWLAFVGSCVVLECIPLGYVFFKNFTNLPDMSIVNCVATFVIIGVGSDLVFVVTDGWRQSVSKDVVTEFRKSVSRIAEATQEERIEAETRTHEREMYLRMVWMYQHAGSSCCTTGICGASSFLVNLMSVLLPLREFGLFMGLCCLFALFLELALFPFAIVASENREFRRRMADAEAALEESRINYSVQVARQVVPCEPAGDDGIDEKSAISAMDEAALKKRSVLIRTFAGPFPDFISRHPMKILAFFSLWMLISLIGIAASIQVDGGLPTIFPKDHNQVLGKEMMERFSAPTKVAAATTRQKALLCGPTAAKGAEKQDKSAGCGTYLSIGYCVDETYKGVMEDTCPRSCGSDAYCLANWCSVAAPPNSSKRAPGRCDCFEVGSADEPAQQPQGEAPEGIVNFDTTVFGFTKETSAKILPYIRKMQLEMLGSATSSSSKIQMLRYNGGVWASAPVQPEAQGQAPLVQQHWRSGTLASWRGFKAPLLSVMTHAQPMPSSAQAESALAASGKVKTINQTCYCEGIAPCLETAARKRTIYHPLAGPGGTTWESVVDVTVKAPQLQQAVPQLRRLAHAPERRLATGFTTLYVVWGLVVRELGPFDLFVETDKVQMWDLDTMFEPADPWAQRSMLRMTENLPEALRAQPKDGSTWLEAFEVWLTSNNLEFPARDFHQSTLTWIDGPGSDYKDHFVRQGGKVVAAKVEFSVKLGGASLDLSLNTMKAWDDHVKGNNDKASIRANGAFHACSKWVSTDAQSGILRSTVSTVFTAVLVGYLAAVMFTQDLLLSMFPMLSVLLTVFSLLFTMVGMLQWPFGAVDVIALIVFLGYMFTFNLHIAHSYSHAIVPQELLENEQNEDSAVSKEELARLTQQERLTRIRFSLMTIGQSLVSSAGTTSSCALFLLFCQLQFFVKFGVVILIVTLLSLVYSMVFLPAMLLAAGPTSRSCRALRKKRKLLLEKLQKASGVQLVSSEPELPVTGNPEVPMPAPADDPPPLEELYVDDTPLLDASPAAHSFPPSPKKPSPLPVEEEEV
eukprot:TRINITY_DN2345_c1_g1_i1.p1 TRINITY_DN2345_c1_g1~~TRINITY_DN2345_c1_g1_i1.p1  ORF type:complete len:1503 (+),score=257.19 TRINITY_DN2345_c1_g1_i1:364-4509(+)